ncbi:Beta-lactamase-like [Lasallia pustulata]|uniref:Beta-lactamase-like n=1 Tax=Lasallia pustulata TaxID=136370 RepID=A0A1W5D1W4_9LECA|nr:Beta-lactamase-like [Lasallia pustulata]
MATQLVPLEDVQRLSPLVIRILGGNPGKFTLQGTNTYLIGTGPHRILIDTGEGLPTWTTLLSHLLTSERATVTLALLTHWHPDHTLGVPSLRALCPSAQIFKTPSPHDPSPGYHAITPNQTFTTEGATLRALPTPGHTADHTALILEQESAIFTGDAVLGHGTAVFEDLPAYMASLERMRREFAGRAYPAHGAVVEDGRARIDDVFYNTVFKQIPLKGRPGGGEFERLNNYHNQERRVI